jgi:hypothetical protein
VDYAWEINKPGQKMGGAILPDMLRWLSRDQAVSTDPNDAVERSFNTRQKEQPARSTSSRWCLQV